MSELIDREWFSADMRDFQNRVGIWRDEAEDTETRTRADAALATIIETKLILDKQPTIPAPRWHRVEDELPKDNTWCVFISENKHNFEQYRWIGTYSEEWGFQDDDAFIVTNVKYWMPIEPPKEEA